jgi:hypothetical protein
MVSGLARAGRAVDVRAVGPVDFDGHPVPDGRQVGFGLESPRVGRPCDRSARLASLRRRRSGGPFRRVNPFARPQAAPDRPPLPVAPERGRRRRQPHRHPAPGAVARHPRRDRGRREGRDARLPQVRHRPVPRRAGRGDGGRGRGLRPQGAVAPRSRRTREWSSSPCAPGCSCSATATSRTPARRCSAPASWTSRRAADRSASCSTPPAKSRSTASPKRSSASRTTPA